jgi:hypothetical protein
MAQSIAYDPRTCTKKGFFLGPVLALRLMKNTFLFLPVQASWLIDELSFQEPTTKISDLNLKYYDSTDKNREVRFSSFYMG